MDKAGAFTSYEDHPYQSLASPHSHPGNMAMVATLLGVEPPPVERCRVLELGCGTGPNLLPMAEDLPEAELIGIDLSPRQIAMSAAAAKTLGLKNVDFRVLDILEVGPALGRFDYIIAHGIYSWVPAPVRDKVLAACQELLTERGLAYVSFNTFPGWHVTNVLRDLLLYHVQRAESPAERVRMANEALDLLAAGVTERGEPPAKFMRLYAQQYKRMLEELGPNRDSSLHHDILAEINDPVYFHDFVAHAERHGLEYVAEAAFQLSMPPDLPKEVRERLGAHVGSVAEMEQYMDFILMRTFRQSVLCRGGRQISRSLQPERLRGLALRTTLSPESSRPDASSLGVERFKGPEGIAISTNHPVSKAALCVLAEIAPRSLTFEELLRAARERLGQPAAEGDADGTSEDAQELGRILLRAFAQRRDIVTARAHLPRIVSEVSERPVARPLARWQAKSSVVVTGAYHESIFLEPLQHCVLPLLDGTRERVAILSELVRMAEAGTLKVERNDRPVTDPTQMRVVLGRDLDLTLQLFGKLGLLVA